MSQAQKFSVVLVPAQPFHSELKKKVLELAEVFDAPEFDPHMTLFSGYVEDVDEATKSFKAAAKKFGRVEATVTGIDYTELFFKTLFIQFELSDGLLQMNESLRQSLDQKSKYILNPHLSLLYKKMPSTTKSSLAEEAWKQLQAILGEERMIMFDKIKMQTGSKKETPEAVRQWRTLAEVVMSK